MKNKIKDVQRYFKDKIINQDYEIVSVTDSVRTLLIDKEYVFKLIPIPRIESFMLYGFDNFMKLDFTDREKEEVWQLIKDDIYKIDKQNKLKEFNKLKQELGL